MNELQNDLLKNVEKLQKELTEIKDKANKQQAELLLVNTKYRESCQQVKDLEKTKQLDDMSMTSLKYIKEESAKEILKLNQQVSTLKLDLLAEKQLRRIHQTELHKFDPTNANYNAKNIAREDEQNSDVAANQPINYSITPFWLMKNEADSCETNKKSAKNDKPYIIPSKIQKSCDSKFNTRPSKFKQFSSPSQKRNFDFNFNPIPSSSTEKTSESSNQVITAPQEIQPQASSSPITETKESSLNTSEWPKLLSFNFSNADSTSFSSLFRFGTPGSPSTTTAAFPTASTSSGVTSNRQQQSKTPPSTPFRTYRDFRQSIDSPRVSDR